MRKLPNVEDAILSPNTNSLAERSLAEFDGSQLSCREPAKWLADSVRGDVQSSPKSLCLSQFLLRPTGLAGLSGGNSPWESDLADWPHQSSEKDVFFGMMLGLNLGCELWEIDSISSESFA